MRIGSMIRLPSRRARASLSPNGSLPAHPGKQPHSAAGACTGRCRWSAWLLNLVAATRFLREHPGTSTGVLRNGVGGCRYSLTARRHRSSSDPADVADGLEGEGVL